MYICVCLYTYIHPYIMVLHSFLIQSNTLGFFIALFLSIFVNYFFNTKEPGTQYSQYFTSPPNAPVLNQSLSQDAVSLILQPPSLWKERVKSSCAFFFSCFSKKCLKSYICLLFPHLTPHSHSHPRQAPTTSLSVSIGYANICMHTSPVVSL